VIRTDAEKKEKDVESLVLDQIFRKEIIIEKN
jgi:hypothetical protein